MRQTPWRREISCWSWTPLPWDAGSASVTIVREMRSGAPTQEDDNDDSDEEWKTNALNRWCGEGPGVDTVGVSVPVKALRHLQIRPPHRWSAKKKKRENIHWEIAIYKSINIVIDEKWATRRQFFPASECETNHKHPCENTYKANTGSLFATRQGQKSLEAKKAKQSTRSPVISVTRWEELLKEDVRSPLDCWSY